MGASLGIVGFRAVHGVQGVQRVTLFDGGMELKGVRGSKVRLGSSNLLSF